MVLLLQHLLGVGIAVAVVAIGWRYFGRLAAITAGVVAAVTPIMLDTEHDVLPDLAFAVAVLAAAVVLAEAVLRHSSSYRLLALAGVIAGLTAYVKPNGQAFVVAAIVPLAFATRSVRRTLAGSAVFALAAVLTLAPWIIRNGIAYDHYSFSAQGGEALFLRVFDQDRLPIPTDTPEGRIASRVHAQAVREAPAGEPITASYSAVKAALTRRGMSGTEAAGVQGDLAQTAIRRDPVRYVAGTARNMGLVLARSSYPRYPVSQLGEKLTADEFPRPIALALWIGGAAVHLGWLVLALGGLTVAAVFVAGSREARVVAITFGWLWLIVAGSVAVANVPAHRLSAQVLPLYLLLGSAGIVATAGIVRERARGRSAVPSEPTGTALSGRERPPAASS
jgi:4-amino-4-deoxy-L-arabinose transferase-like glycosyltransferase